MTLLFASCEKDIDREVFPHSIPVLENAKIVSVGTNNPSIAVFGDSIEFTALVTDVKTPLSTLTFQMISTDGKLLLSDNMIVRNNTDEVKVRYKIPFVSNLEDQTLQVLLVLENAEGDSIHSYLPQANNVFFKRPTLGDQLYLVTETESIITLTRSKEDKNVYFVDDLDITNPDFKYRIAEKIEANGKIDYNTGIVWGNLDSGVGIIDETTGSSINFDNSNNTIIHGFTFNAFTFTSNVETKYKDIKAINGTVLAGGTYDGYLSATLKLTKDQEVSLIGFNEDSLNPYFFTYMPSEKAKFIGLDGVYSVHYNSTTGFLYVEQTDAIYPNALWICGTGMGFPLETLSATSKWDWNVPSDNIFCCKVSDGVFQATCYAENFDLKFFHQRTWGTEEKSGEYTTTSTNLWSNTDDGNWKAIESFTNGVYKVTINVTNKTANLEEVN